MFSASDIRELLWAFPPGRPEPFAFEQPQPFLIPNATADGFVASNCLSREFDELLENGSGRISMASLGSQLNVSEDTILQLSQRASGNVVTSKDQRLVCTRTESQRILEELVARASRGLVLEAAFAQEADITIRSLKNLTKLHNQSVLDGRDPGFLSLHAEQEPTAKTFIYTNGYRNSLEDALRESFRHANAEAKVFSKRADEFGIPSASFVMEAVQHVIDSEVSHSISGAKILLEKDSIYFRPSSYDLRRKEELTDSLKNGSTQYVQLVDILDIFPETDGDSTKVQSLLKANLSESTFFTTNYAVSSAWFEKWVSQLTETVKSVGCVMLGQGSGESVSGVPQEIGQEAAARIGSTLVGLPRSSPIVVLGDLIIRTSILQSITSIIRDEAKKLARLHWDALVENAEVECKFEMSQLSVDAIRRSGTDVEALEDEVLRVVLAAPNTAQEAGSAYASELRQKLQPETEEAFRAFWSDRVMARFQLHRRGVEGVEDDKLSEQLTVLLKTYAQKELVPDNVSKARLRGFFRIKKIQRGIEKLSTTLGEQHISLEAIQTALEMFNSKQGLHWLGAAELASKKEDHLWDLRRTMQKDNDGPRLLLTTVLILLAREQEGIIYATGKFVPRLMKQLKTRLDEGVYEKLEEWKDKIRAGTLTDEDKESMRGLGW